MRILLDLDNVLVDFDRSAARVHGLTLDQLMPHREPGVWDMCPALSKAKGEKITLNKFWNPIIEEGAYFWATIPPLPWISDLLAMVVHAEWRIVTTPNREVSSYAGKAAWAKGWFGSTFDKLHITPHKEDFADPGTILVDDNQDNIDKFANRGGQTVLFPSIGNRLHGIRNSPLQYVKQRLGELDAL